MAVYELIDNYESGRGSVKGRQHTVKRVLMVDSYPGLNDPDVPKYKDPHPLDPNLLVTQIDYEGFGPVDDQAEGLLKYTGSKIVVTYSTSTYGDFTLSRKEMEGELLSIGGYGTFSSSGNIVELPRSIPVAIWKIVVPRRMSVEPASAIMNLWDCVNNANFTLDGYTFPPETVLFQGASSRKVWDATEEMIMHEIEFYFKVNFRGWNSAYDGLAGVWDIVLPRQFTPANFNVFPL